MKSASKQTMITVTLIGVMGFNSGLPLALTASTLVAWLKLSGVSLPIIGLFALVGLAYSVKFLWAPFFDVYNPPLPKKLVKKMGRQSGWILIVGIALAAAMVGLGSSEPGQDFWLHSFIAASLLAICSASFDCLIDGWRVVNVPAPQQGLAAASTQYGYRIGMLMSGAGGLWLSTMMPWSLMYLVMAVIFLLGLALTLIMVREQPATEKSLAASRPAQEKKSFRDHVFATIFDPLKEFALRRGWWVILLMIVLYKVGDAVSGAMAVPFYLELGYERGQIASASKIFGLMATLVGVALGGIMVLKLGRYQALLIGGILQGVSTFSYLILIGQAPDTSLLALAVALENLTGGMGSAALVAYLSALCSVRYSATHYALLSALAGVGRTLFASSGGIMALSLGWAWFFILMGFAALPGIALLLWIKYSKSIDAELSEA